VTTTQRIRELEQTLDEVIKRYDLCLKFKGTYLCERQGDFDAIDRFRRILNDRLPDDEPAATWHQESHNK